jgi:hypothetical protein
MIHKLLKASLDPSVATSLRNIPVKYDIINLLRPVAFFRHLENLTGPRLQCPPTPLRSGSFRSSSNTRTRSTRILSRSARRKHSSATGSSVWVIWRSAGWRWRRWRAPWRDIKRAEPNGDLARAGRSRVAELVIVGDGGGQLAEPVAAVVCVAAEGDVRRQREHALPVGAVIARIGDSPVRTSGSPRASPRRRRGQSAPPLAPVEHGYGGRGVESRVSLH